MMTIAERIAARKTPNVIQCVLLDPSETERDVDYFFHNNNNIYYYYHINSSIIIKTTRGALYIQVAPG